MKFIGIVFLVFFCFASVGKDSSSASQPALKGQDYLIEKLKKYHQTLPQSHFSKKAITLRLAHMLSLRAERHVSRGWSQNCKPCLQEGYKEARRAVALYEQLDSHMEKNHSSLYILSLFERAYLSHLLDNKSRSIAYLRRVIASKPSPVSKARAYFNLGEIYFDSHQYQSALSSFHSVLSSENKWFLRSSYKKIWSLYNLSRYEEAIVALEFLLSSDFYKSEHQSPVDQELKNRIKNEIITFYSRAPLTQKSLDFLYQWGEANTQERNQRLFDLGIALHRIGRTQESNQVWNQYLLKEVTPLKRLEAHVYKLDNYLMEGEEGFFKRAEKSLNETLRLAKKAQPCRVSICKLVQERIKDHILIRADSRFHKQQASFFAKYNDVYPGEFKMIFYEARLAKNLEQYQKAQDLFEKAVLAIDSQIPEKEKQLLERDKEKASALQMEMAEASQDKKRRSRAYQFYLRHGSDPELFFKAQYQQAYLLYEDKKYKKSARAFKKLAFDQKVTSLSSRSLKLKSAHLSLTSLSFTKNDPVMKDWSLAFAKEFPKQSKEFKKIHNKAVFNIVKNLVSGKTFSNYPLQSSRDRGFIKSWKVLHELDLGVVSQKEKTYFYMNKLLLAKELLKMKEVKQSLRQLAGRKLDKKDQRLVLGSRLWLAESQFDFKNMLKFIKKLEPNNRSKEHLIYLAYLSELAGKDYFSLYEEIINRYPQSEEAFSLAVRMVELQTVKNKPILLKKYHGQLSRKPEIFSYLILKTDEGRLNERFIQAFLTGTAMKSSNLAQFIERKQFIESFKKQNKPLEKFILPSQLSQRDLVRFLKTYKSLLQDLEKRAGRAVELQDWTSQVVAFTTVKKELTRFYESILTLPLPKDLTEEEKVQYTQLLEQQMAPYKIRVGQLNLKLKELWGYNYKEAYRTAYEKDHIFRKPVEWEIQQLQAVAPEEKQKEFRRLVLQSRKNNQGPSPLKEVSKKKINQVYVQLKEKPFDSSALRELILLEEKRKNEVMVFYLQSRLKKLNQMRRREVSL